MAILIGCRETDFFTCSPEMRTIAPKTGPRIRTAFWKKGFAASAARPAVASSSQIKFGLWRVDRRGREQEVARCRAQPGDMIGMQVRQQHDSQARLIDFRPLLEAGAQIVSAILTAR